VQIGVEIVVAAARTGPDRTNKIRKVGKAIKQQWPEGIHHIKNNWNGGVLASLKVLLSNHLMSLTMLAYVPISVLTENLIASVGEMREVSVCVGPGSDEIHEETIVVSAGSEGASQPQLPPQCGPNIGVTASSRGEASGYL